MSHGKYLFSSGCSSPVLYLFLLQHILPSTTVPCTLSFSFHFPLVRAKHRIPPVLFPAAPGQHLGKGGQVGKLAKASPSFPRFQILGNSQGRISPRSDPKVQRVSRSFPKVREIDFPNVLRSIRVFPRSRSLFPKSNFTAFKANQSFPSFFDCRCGLRGF